MSNPKFKKLSGLGGLPQGGYPNQVHLGGIEVEDLWGQILIFEGQIRCIGPREPPGSKN